jgi:hypothetical protein
MPRSEPAHPIVVRQNPVWWVVAFLEELGHLDYCLNADNGQCLSKMDSAA